MNNKKINNDLMKFWDTALKISEEDKKEMSGIQEDDYKELAPSEKLLLAAKSLGTCHKVLDYGCGNAWGAIIANKSGCKDVEAVDIGENIIETAKFYAQIFGANINAHAISIDWLKNEAKQEYDGIICSNVLDVVPFETTKEIIEQLARISLSGASLVIGLNYYLPLDKAKEKGMDVRDDKYLFVDNVLRLLSLKDEEWKALFAPYFDIEKLEYFAWPNEEMERRRLFYLRKKQEQY